MNIESATPRNARIHGAGSVATNINVSRLHRLENELHNIDLKNAAQKSVVDQRLQDALQYIENVRSFVGSPENILGSTKTKHGEIAEQVNVNFHNARRVMNGKVADATFEGVGRTAPEDYIVGGVRVQSKYINGSNQSLSHVLDHLETYKNIEFGRDGSYYVIPKDQYKQIQDVLAGKAGNLSEKTIRAIQTKVHQIETTTGKSFNTVVHPGEVEYAAVQQGAIHKTLDQESQRLQNDAAKQQSKIDEKSQQKREVAAANAKPSWGEAAKTAGIAAAFSGGIQLSFRIYQKCKSGKKLNEFSTEDWKEIGIDTAKATAEGGISGLALYGVTNFASNIPVPMASAGISFAFNLAELAYDCAQDKITQEEFKEACQISAVNSAVCAVGAAMGSAVIPIPVLGAVIGSAIAGNVFNTLCEDGVNYAIENSSAYVYGMTQSLVAGVRAIESNAIRTRTNLRQATEIQKSISNHFDEFDKIMGRQ